ncbi:MAG: alpha/beta fold hydrolase [Candidatus Competibacterales bacterium]
MNAPLPAQQPAEPPWYYKDHSFEVGLTRRGEGPTALLLPALSTISTRGEMAPLQACLAPHFATVAVDWPAFGVAPKPKLAWSPEGLADFLRHLFDEVVPAPALVVAAGHGAGYLLRHLQRRPADLTRGVLIAPTWRGPFPTMLGKRPEWLATVRRTIDTPVIGPAGYALNVSPPMIRRMTRGHVYADPNWLTGERLAAKRAVTQSRGARHASVRFVTGALDPFDAAAAFVAAAKGLEDRLQVIYGEQTPPKSKAEMETLAAALTTPTTVIPRAKLAVHEEFPDPVAQAILAFVGESGSSGA